MNLLSFRSSDVCLLQPCHKSLENKHCLIFRGFWKQMLRLSNQNSFCCSFGTLYVHIIQFLMKLNMHRGNVFTTAANTVVFVWYIFNLSHCTVWIPLQTFYCCKLNRFQVSFQVSFTLLITFQLIHIEKASMLLWFLAIT